MKIFVHPPAGGGPRGGDSWRSAAIDVVEFLGFVALATCLELVGHAVIGLLAYLGLVAAACLNGGAS